MARTRRAVSGVISGARPAGARVPLARAIGQRIGCRPDRRERMGEAEILRRDARDVSRYDLECDVLDRRLRLRRGVCGDRGGAGRGEGAGRRALRRRRRDLDQLGWLPLSRRRYGAAESPRLRRLGREHVPLHDGGLWSRARRGSDRALLRRQCRAFRVDRETGRSVSRELSFPATTSPSRPTTASPTPAASTSIPSTRSRRPRPAATPRSRSATRARC